MTSASSQVNALLADSVLCVAVDNNEVVGDYISTPKEQTMAVAKAFSQNLKQYSFVSEASVAVERRTTYYPGDSIPVFSKAADTPIHGPSLFGWGSTGGSSRCTHRMPVRFANDWEEESCVLNDADLSVACEAAGSWLDPSAVAHNLLVAKTPNVVSATAASNDIVSLEVNVREVDLSTGAVLELQTPYPSYYPKPQLTPGSTSQASTCKGALLGVAYVIFHSGSGAIERVKATITIAKLITASQDVTQSFSVRFVSTATVTRSLERGNVATYERSGNPGYQLQLPVRVGIAQTGSSTSQAVAEMTGGLTLSALDDCEDVFTSRVLFGEDAQLTCTLRLDASAFQSFCTSTLPSALRVNFTHVATFGNSDPYLIDEWLEIDYDEPTKLLATFIDAKDAGTVEMQCKDVLSSLHIEFLVASVGPVNDPQDKIVAARAFHGKATWSLWKNPRDMTRQETYVLTRTVSFVRVKTLELDQWIPPTPPIWFSIPSDVFYPFQLSSSTRTVPSWTLQVMLWLSVGCALAA